MRVRRSRLSEEGSEEEKAAVVVWPQATSSEDSNRNLEASTLETMRAGIIAIVASSVALAASPSDYPACDSSTDIGSLCSIEAADLLPTQALVGNLEVACKTARYQSMSTKDLDKYLVGQVVPVVLGPEGFYMTDKHHTVRALLEAGGDVAASLVVANLTLDLSRATSMSAFWSLMLVNDQMWLYDDRGRAPINPSLVPSTPLRMVNDPYRSLAWAVRNNGGYAQLPLPFQDFQYALFMRQNNILPLPPNATSGSVTAGRWSYCDAAPLDDVLCFTNEEDIVMSNLGAALALVTSPAAQGLPGWGQGVVDYPNCGNSSQTA